MKKSSVLDRIESVVQDLVLLFVRITIGWQFFVTGKGKLENIEVPTKFFESLDIPAPAFQAHLVGGVEMIGGLLLLVGLLTRVASVPLISIMIVAYFTAHADKAFQDISSFAGEHPFAFLMGCLVTLAFGAGRISLDRAIGWKRRFSR